MPSIVPIHAPCPAALSVVARASRTRRRSRDQLAAALAATDIAAVLLRLAASRRAYADQSNQGARSAVQAHGAALLIDGHPDSSRVPARTALISAAASLRVGDCRAQATAHCRRRRAATRHDAMIAAEAGVDYVMFGDPDARGAGRRSPRSRSGLRGGPNCSRFLASLMRSDLATWASYVHAGADFVAIGEPAFADPRGCAAALAQARAQVTA